GRGPCQPRLPAGGALVVGAPGLHAGRKILGVPAGDRRIVALVEQQPLVGLGFPSERVALSTRSDNRVAAMQPLPVQAELELAGGEGGRRIIGLFGGEGAPVP